MGWPLRMFQKEGLYFVTSRCFHGRLLLRPSAEMNEVVGGMPGDWSGIFWERCYSAEPVLDDTALGCGGCLCPGA